LFWYRTFEWLDEKKGKKMAKVPAQKFMDSSLTQIQKQLEDERIFPTKFGKQTRIYNQIQGWLVIAVARIRARIRTSHANVLPPTIPRKHSV